ncbi:DNA-directed RNA polymerase subunit beta [Gossypium arboreum]|uniref:DNA-directed RNA polymerase subunit beta n=1 Tax=Gossypium arboreum TaxID=29729 RepID=A0A0B0PTL8_GOSAR|nr:DNA-directed RNA polymerase subunit beta [Gossypium arboreum]KHG27698.1 DNA-directed RNA polymerase subunit beta [Gossypium arboreum]
MAQIFVMPWKWYLAKVVMLKRSMIVIFGHDAFMSMVHASCISRAKRATIGQGEGKGDRIAEKAVRQHPRPEGNCASGYIRAKARRHSCELFYPG